MPEGLKTAQSAQNPSMEAADLHRRERQAFGGTIRWEAAFFGWLAAIGLAALMVAMVDRWAAWPSASPTSRTARARRRRRSASPAGRS